MIFGYTRISKANQDDISQKIAIENYASKRGIKLKCIISDQGNGSISYKERKLGLLIKELKKHDTIVVSEISMLSCDIFDGMQLLFDLCRLEIKVYVCAIDMIFDCKNLKTTDKLIFFTALYAAETGLQSTKYRTNIGMSICKSKGIKVGRSNEKYGNNPNDTRTKEERLFAKEKGRLTQRITKNKTALFTPQKEAILKLYRQVEPKLEAASVDGVIYWLNWSRNTARITMDHHKKVAKLINEDNAAEGIFNGKVNPFYLKEIWNSTILGIKRYNDLNKELEQFNETYKQFKNR